MSLEIISEDSRVDNDEKKALRSKTKDVNIKEETSMKEDLTEEIKFNGRERKSSLQLDISEISNNVDLPSLPGEDLGASPFTFSTSKGISTRSSSPNITKKSNIFETINNEEDNKWKGAIERNKYVRLFDSKWKGVV